MAAVILVWRIVDLQTLDLEAQISGAKATEAELLFAALRDQGLLALDSEQRIEVEPKDYFLAELQRPGEKDSAQLKDQDRLLKIFYGEGPGRTLQDWIAQWNRGRVMSAVRDNRPDGAESEWVPYDPSGMALSQYGRVPLEFGYVMDGVLPQGFGDWSVAPAEEVEWRSTIRLKKAARISLHVIGKPNTSHLPRHGLLACLPKVSPGRSNCSGSDSDQAQAYQIHLSLPAGEHHLRLPAKPIRNPRPDDRDLPLALVGGRIEWVPLRERYSRNLIASRPPATFVARTADGTALTTEDGKGRPTPFTVKNGLAALVGFGPEYGNALSGTLAQAVLAEAGEVRLTLDGKLQAVAQAELERRLKEVAVRNPDDAIERRAAVVILDAQSGAILAAANHPSPPAHTRRWDRAAFSVTWPNRDPFRFTPWIGTDVHMTPGSTFKVVTALAAIKAAGEGRGDVADMLEGWGSSRFERKAGISPGTACYEPRGASEVCNFRNGSIAGAFHKALRRGTCQKRPDHSDSLGLREAVRDSLNVWFVRLAEVMDRGNLASGGGDTFLAKEAKTLGFGQRFALFPEIGGIGGDALDGPGRGSVLSAMSGRLDLFDPKMKVPMQRLSQNSFGQGVQVTPLQMARVAAAVATGRVPQPTLLQSWEGRPVEPPEAVDLELDGDLLDRLRQGMKAVPEAGTAEEAFRSENLADSCRTYGKTGTAQTRQIGPKHFLNSGWFIGWRDNSKQEPDIAFACVMTHSDGGTGGGLCGYLMARILKEWDR
ncbi:MAG: hypothetical protein KJ558_11220 [Gammaproteobacteria bacterium]|nr:hypothetical protein [Gammaproteobacteria bacterium]MBU1655377.1 hypothetical protein [Gammaproteobacteria bacterium]MBU1960355.1 hypothetical protein [Gammaproteobacteria bacterium]